VINKRFTKVYSLIRSYFEGGVRASYIEIDSGSEQFWPPFVVEPRALKQCFDNSLKRLS
jgi:hypothetical protein